MPRAPHPPLVVAAYRAEEVAQILQCSKRSVYRLIEGGELRAVHVGRAVRIPRRALDDFLNAPASRNGAAAPDAPPRDDAVSPTSDAPERRR